MTLTSEGQTARNSVYLSLAQIRMLNTLLPPDDPWKRDLIGESEMCLWGISNIVTVVELFVTTVAIEHSEKGLSDLPPAICKDLTKGLRKRAEQSWDTRVEVIKFWTGVNLKDSLDWRCWNGFIEARNAWAHGQGALTRRQIQDEKSMSDSFALAGLKTSEGRISADLVALARCAETGSDFIKRVDATIAR